MCKNNKQCTTSNGYHVVQIRVVHVVQILKCKHWLVPERRLSVNAFW